jgi:hypothetical protein
MPNTRTNLEPIYALEGTPLGCSMLPKRLAEAGYVSYHVGKWHQGAHARLCLFCVWCRFPCVHSCAHTPPPLSFRSLPTTGLYAPQFTPRSRGFNYTDGFLAGSEDHFQQYARVNCKTMVSNLFLSTFVFSLSPSQNTLIILFCVCLFWQSDPVQDIWVDDAVAPQFIGNYTGMRFSSRAVYWIDKHTHRYALLHVPGAAEHPWHSSVAALSTRCLCRGFETPAGTVSTVDSTVHVGNVTEACNQGLLNNTLLVWMTAPGQ